MNWSIEFEIRAESSYFGSSGVDPECHILNADADPVRRRNGAGSRPVLDRSGRSLAVAALLDAGRRQFARPARPFDLFLLHCHRGYHLETVGCSDIQCQSSAVHCPHR